MADAGAPHGPETPEALPTAARIPARIRGLGGGRGGGGYRRGNGCEPSTASRAPLDVLLALAAHAEGWIWRRSRCWRWPSSTWCLSTRRTSFASSWRADYLVMAAWLAYLKSRLLLPREVAVEGQPSGEELAARLAFRLKRLEAMRNAAAQLMTRKRLGRDIFRARGMPEGMPHHFACGSIRASSTTLLKAYAEQRRRTTQARATSCTRRTVWSIKEARQRLEAMIGEWTGEWLQLTSYFEQYLSTPEGRQDGGGELLRGDTGDGARGPGRESPRRSPSRPIYVRKREEGAVWQPVG